MSKAQRPEEPFVVLPSTLESVTLHQRGARVRRIAPLDGVTGGRLRLDDLPLCLDDASLAARIEGEGPGEALVRDLRCRLVLPGNCQVEDEPSEKALEEAELELQGLELKIAEIDSALSDLEDLSLVERPVGRKGEAPPPSPVAARVALVESACLRAEGLGRDRERLREERRLQSLEVETLRRRMADASTARQAKPDELRKAVDLELTGSLPKEGARIVLEYFVPGARWAPTYALELDETMSSARLRMRALVRQRTGEDWTGVRLSLSTADVTAWLAGPELPSMRIGRKQAPPPLKGWRPAPSGLDALFGDFDRAFAGGAPPPPLAPREPPEPSPCLESEEEDSDFEKECAKTDKAPSAMGDSFEGAMPPCPPPRPSPSRSMAAASMTGGYGGANAVPPSAPGGALRSRAPMEEKRERLKAKLKAKKAGRRSHARGDAVDSKPSFDDELVTPEDLMDYGRLRMAAPSEGGRGRLVLTRQERRYVELLEESRVEISFDLGRVLVDARERAEAVASRAAAPACAFPDRWEGFDYAFTGTVTVDVPSDGTDHVVPVDAFDLPCSLRYVTVPREAKEVFRAVTLRNPSEGPLPRGPVDVTVGREFLLSTAMKTLAPGGELDLGLGVEEGIEVARNTRFSEETSGLLGGSLCLHHEIRLEVVNRLDRLVQLEIRERIPRAGGKDEDLTVELGDVEPPWEDFDQRPHVIEGGHRWLLELEGGQTRELSAAYDIHLPSKYEVVGGNRREA